jgi:hypothetical protein
MNSEYIIDVRYYAWLNIWSFIEYNILWSTSQWVFCCFARGSVGASSLNSNLRFTCESLQKYMECEDVRIVFSVLQVCSQKYWDLSKPFRTFSWLRVTGTLKIQRAQMFRILEPKQTTHAAHKSRSNSLVKWILVTTHSSGSEAENSFRRASGELLGQHERGLWKVWRRK